MSASFERVKDCLQRESHDLISSQGVLVGMDIGSYGLRVIVADVQGQQVHTDHRPMSTSSPDDAVEQVLALAHGVLGHSGKSLQHVARVGIGFGGPVDCDAGVTRLSHRFAGWEHYPLAARIEEALDAPALLDNDANLIALGEARCGAGRDVRHLFYLHLSSGVGGGLVLNDRVYHGATMTAGEIGHATVRSDGPPCSCGGRGHLESYVSVGGLLRRANELGMNIDDLEQVFSSHDGGRQTLDEAVNLLGLALSNVVSLLDPQLIVVGGVVTRIGGDTFVQSISQHLEASLPPSMRRNVPVVASTFGYDSVAVGALALAMQSLWD
jgi:glucokinase